MTSDRSSTPLSTEEILFKLELVWCEYTGGHLGASEFNDLVCGLIAEQIVPRHFGKQSESTRRESPTLDEMATPITDAHLAHLNLPDGRKVGIPNETVALLRQLERDYNCIAASVTPSAVPTREWITCPATGQTCHEYCDPGQGDVCAKDGGPTPMFAPSAGVQSAIGRTCPENNLPCERACLGGWCQTMFGFPPEDELVPADRKIDHGGR